MCFFVHFCYCDGMSTGGTNRGTRRRSDQTSADSVELNKPVRDVVGFLFFLSFAVWSLAHQVSFFLFRESPSLWLLL